jgi:Cupin-like domain
MMQLDAVERIVMPPYESLRERYLARNIPVIVTNLATSWPALARWSPAFFRTHYGERLVDVTDQSFQQHGAHYLKPFGKMRFASYLDAIENEPADLRLFLFELFKFAPELRGDIRIPSWAGPLSHLFLVSFFGGAGGASTFHYDVDLPHVFHTMIHGSKSFYLYAPDESAKLYRHPMTVRSYVDVRAPDLVRHPLFREARGRQCVLNAGETLVIPSGHWHQAVYAFASWGLSFRKYEAHRVPAGLVNMLVKEPIDRMLAKLAPRQWFAYKERASRERSTRRHVK